jgi:hypothetical protein
VAQYRKISIIRDLADLKYGSNRGCPTRIAAQLRCFSDNNRHNRQAAIFRDQQTKNPASRVAGFSVKRIAVLNLPHQICGVQRDRSSAALLGVVFLTMDAARLAIFSPLHARLFGGADMPIVTGNRFFRINSGLTMFQLGHFMLGQ